ncbi:MAG: tRNA (5-methylaminomethyl-2-thiouridine)(34)-methyltransferase MnmD [Aureliella sp.]
MGIPVRKESPTVEDDLVWVECDDGSRTLKNLRLNESYHSGCGAISESLCVYLANSGIASMLAPPQPPNVAPARLVEYGFGTGTNFILTAALAEYFGSPLSYCGLENRLLPNELIGTLEISDSIAAASTGASAALDAALRLLSDSCGSIDLCNYLDHLRVVERRLREVWFQLQAKPEFGASEASQEAVAHRIHFSNQVELALWVGDATKFDASSYSELFSERKMSCDAVYFDAFAPEVSPELWTQDVFRNAFSLLSASGKLTSYCVKGAIRRELKSVGFQPRCVPGPPGGKREVLVASPA